MGTAGCSDDGDNPVSGAVSEAASAVASAAEGVTDAASEAADKAEAQMAEIKDGVDAKDEVELGDPATDADGRTTVPVTVRNTDDASRSFAIQVRFEDGDGKLLDAVGPHDLGRARRKAGRRHRPQHPQALRLRDPHGRERPALLSPPRPAENPVPSGPSGAQTPPMTDMDAFRTAVTAWAAGGPGDTARDPRRPPARAHRGAPGGAQRRRRRRGPGRPPGS
ncbi:hypothetical protein Shyd_84080 [Streptomyces hydrogenans]|uniref:Lipoprotein n=1 Tax=Streptomyces hydrogenans TaxID=1873719 RepID=A0ABQ3PPT2_9ACTN|nr:hypothetical protein Shyd_84080 [Streptomyces hydrogenans]